MRLLHLEWGLLNPIKDNFHLSCVLKGLRRSLGDCPTRKLPITPDILRGIRRKLNFSCSLDLAVWAAALCLFYGMLRRSNVIPLSVNTFKPQLHLRRQDIVVEPWGLSLIIRWIKTVQFRERNRSLPLPAMARHPLCPVRALLEAFAATPQSARDGPAFTYLASNGLLRTLTAGVFIRRIRACIGAEGLDTSSYASHSFRRGSASWAYQTGLNVETIRQMGDWKSYACLAYITLPDKSLLSAVKKMQDSL